MSGSFGAMPVSRGRQMDHEFKSTVLVSGFRTTIRLEELRAG
jgi:hypothetical protein